MMLSDDELLHIDGEPPENFDLEEARQALRQHGDIYRYQLVAAIQLEERAQMFEEQTGESAALLGTPEFVAGRIHALREVAANLRCGSYLPGGDLLDRVLPHIGPE